MHVDYNSLKPIALREGFAKLGTNPNIKYSINRYYMMLAERSYANLTNTPLNMFQKIADEQGNLIVENNEREKEGRKPETLGTIFEMLMREQGMGYIIDLGRLNDEWEAIVGKRNAINARISGYKNGTLYIQAKTSTWVGSLNLLKRKILAQIKERGIYSIESITVTLPKTERYDRKH
ncbi:MAG: DUF721 domain-containing protein [Bifidobacteriaceae bacterium]|jgi:hypothetical protein|nr:DUF721 domain-containing protein [Bifidobacteriaceae bacterium]